MPASMSAAEPTPSPSAKHASLTSWATIRPSTSPGASPTRSACRPSVAKKRSAAASGRGVVGPAVSSTSRPSGGDAGGSRRRAAGSCAASGARRRGAAAGRPGAARRLVGAAVDDQRRHLAVRASGARRPSPRLAAAQLVGERAVARDHDEAVAAAGLGRLGVGRPARRVLVPAAPGLAAEAPGGDRAARRAATGASAARRTTARRTSARSRSRRRSRRGPSARTGPSGSRRPCGRCGRPARASRAAPATSRSASSANGRLQRLTRKPGAVGGVDHVLAHRLAGLAGARERARRLDSAPATTSTSRITRRRVEEVHADDALGRGTPAASAVTLSEEVLVASTQSGSTTSRERGRTARA